MMTLLRRVNARFNHLASSKKFQRGSWWRRERRGEKIIRGPGF
jgi:hypothetical protein